MKSSAGPALLIACLICSGCDPAYGVRATIESPTAGNLGCASEALKAQGLNVVPDSETRLVVQSGTYFANLSATQKGFELSGAAADGPLSCGEIRQAAPFLRSIVKAVRDLCSGETRAVVIEQGDQQRCGSSIVTEP